MKPRFFATPQALRAWLAEHHKTESELWVGFHKVDSGRPSITWAQSVDEALCFGWIDGIRKRLDEESYVIRFTPRKANSNWSLVNANRFPQLLKEGRVVKAGVDAFERRAAARTGIYAYENRGKARFSPVETREFQGHAKAWAFFESQAPSYKKAATWYVVSAKRDATRRSRLSRLISDSEKGQRIGPVTSPSRRAKPVSPTPSKT